MTTTTKASKASKGAESKASKSKSGKGGKAPAAAPAPAPRQRGGWIAALDERTRDAVINALPASHSGRFFGAKMLTKDEAKIAVLRYLARNGASHANVLKPVAPFGNYAALRAELTAAGLLEAGKMGSDWAPTAAGRKAGIAGALPGAPKASKAAPASAAGKARASKAAPAPATAPGRARAK